ncbi:unnamed protein product [Ixodes pacificus]
MVPHVTMCSPMLRQILRAGSYLPLKSFKPSSTRCCVKSCLTCPASESGQSAQVSERSTGRDQWLAAIPQAGLMLSQEKKEFDDKYKRSLADSENLRMRMLKQVEEARVFGIQKFCKDLLDVADVLDSALSSVPEEAIVPDNPHLHSLFTGLKMTQAQMQTVFRRHGLTQLNPIGLKFNPNEHQAVFVHQDATKPPGTVAVVSKIGYKLQDRTIRPAMVGVVERT